MADEESQNLRGAAAVRLLDDDVAQRGPETYTMVGGAKSGAWRIADGPTISRQTSCETKIRMVAWLSVSRPWPTTVTPTARR